MPIYEYKCSDCNTLFETIVNTSGAETVNCKKCGSAQVKKTISASNFKLASGGSKIPSGALSGCSSKSGFS